MKLRDPQTRRRERAETVAALQQRRLLTEARATRQHVQLRLLRLEWQALGMNFLETLTLGCRSTEPTVE